MNEFPNIDKLVKHPSVILIKGARGSGKSCLGYYLLEVISHKFTLQKTIVGFPNDQTLLLPHDIQCIDDITTLPPNSITLIDEAGLKFYARTWQEEEHTIIGQLIDYSRQNQMTIIFITHHTRKLDINIITDIDMLIMKKPSLFHSKFERPEIRALTKEADEFFAQVQDKPIYYSWIYSDEYIGAALNATPSFWSEKLSVIYGKTLLPRATEQVVQDSPIEIKLPTNLKELPIVTITANNMIIAIPNEEGKIAPILITKDKRIAHFFYIQSKDLPNLILKNNHLIDVTEKRKIIGSVIL